MTGGHGEKFRRKTEEAIAALLTQPTIREAAKTAGVGEKTLWRWLQDEDFCQSYRKARRQVVQQAVTRLQQISGEAVEALRGIMVDNLKPPTSRVMAARIVLDTALKFVELEDLEARVVALEKKM
jgi:hypothetical protein